METSYKFSEEAGDAKFGFSMMQHLGEGNISFSPFSIRTALSMLYEGARGETAAEMERAAFIQADGELRTTKYKELISDLKREDSAYVLRVANGLWADRRHEIKGDYIDLLRENYSAEAEVVDFRNVEFWRKRINRWVEDITEKKINELFPPSSINASSALVLANAVYFFLSYIFYPSINP